MNDCPFCHISCRILSQSDLVISFCDGYPTSPGHALVAPKRHVETYFECTPEEKAALWGMVETVRRILEERKPNGFNIGFNVGKAAGQTVFHAHIHVIPRYDGDVPDLEKQRIKNGVKKVSKGWDGIYCSNEDQIVTDPDAANLLQALTRAINNREFLSSIDEDSLDVIKGFMKFLKNGAFRIS